MSNDDATADSCSLYFVDAIDTGEIGDGETGAGFVAVRKFVSFFFLGILTLQIPNISAEYC